MDWVSELYYIHAPKMFQVAIRILRDRETAEDVVQNVFVKALDKEKTLQTHENIGGWLYVTLRNEIGNVLKQRAAHQIIPIEEGLIEGVAPEPISGLMSTLPEQLSEEDKKLLTARYEMELSYTEISNMMGVNAVTCRARVSRAKKRLRHILAPVGHIICDTKGTRKGGSSFD